MELQLGVDTQKGNTFSITLANNIHHNFKVGTKSCRGAGEYACVVEVYEYLATCEFYCCVGF